MSRPTATWRSALFSTGNSASPYTASTAWTPAANSLIVAFVCNTATSPADPTSVSAHGVALTKVATGLALSTTHILSVWVGDAGGSPSNAAASATVGGTPTGCVVDEFEVTNWNTGLGSALAAVTLNNTGTGSATSGSIAVRLAAETVDESAWLSFYVHLANETSTGQGGNWTATAGGNGNFNTPATGAIGQDNDTGYTATATASWSSSSSYAGLVLRVAGTTSASPSETVKITDTVTARLNPDPVSVASENIKVADTVAPILAGDDLSSVITAEVLHIQDAPPVNAEQVKITDTVTAAFAASGGDLSTPTLLESLNVQDTAYAALGSDEILHLTDGPAAAELTTDLSRQVSSEDLKVQDTVQIIESPLVAAPAVESLKVQDQTPPNAVRVEAGDLTPAPLTETLKLDDTVTVDLPLQPGLLVEGLRLNDQPPFVEERLRITDAVTAQIGGGDLVRAVADEVLKLADAVAAFEDPLQTSTAAEALKVQDSVTASENPLFASVADEGLKVQDGTVSARTNPDQVSLTAESLKISDQTPPGAVLSGADLIQVSVPDESLKVQDSVTVSENPLFAAPAVESLKVSDSVTVSEDPLVAAPAVDSLKVQDSVSTLENPLQNSTASESLKVQDQTPPQAILTGSSLLAATITPDESVKVSDSASTSINPEFAAPAVDSLKVSDSVQAALAVSASVTQEVLKLADTVTAAVGLSATVTQESLKISDTVSSSVTVLLTTVSDETVKVADLLSLGVDLLSVTIAPENLKLEDYVVVPVTADYRVYVRPRVSGVKVKRGPL